MPEALQVIALGPGTHVKGGRQLSGDTIKPYRAMDWCSLPVRQNPVGIPYVHGEPAFEHRLISSAWEQTPRGRPASRPCRPKRWRRFATVWGNNIGRAGISLFVRIRSAPSAQSGCLSCVTLRTQLLLIREPRERTTSDPTSVRIRRTPRRPQRTGVLLSRKRS